MVSPLIAVRLPQWCGAPQLHGTKGSGVVFAAERAAINRKDLHAAKTTPDPLPRTKIPKVILHQSDRRGCGDLSAEREGAERERVRAGFEDGREFAGREIAF